MIKRISIILILAVIAVILMLISGDGGMPDNGSILSSGKLPVQETPGNGSESPDVPSSEPDGTPVPSPVSTPVPTPIPTPEPPRKATLVSAGDCVLHLAFQKSAYVDEEQRYDFYDIFSTCEDYLAGADVSIISFESAATNKRSDYTGYPQFNCPPEIFDAFKKVGFGIVNNSNNHQLDRRLSGMLETRDNIKSRGLDVLGVYEGEDTRYLIREANGIRIGIMAYTYGCNMNELALSEEERRDHLALIDEDRIRQELLEMESDVDVTVVCMHWGVEYTQKPTEQQKQLARKMIGWGADVILGSHPHVVEPSEMIEFEGEWKYIIYSMGNFVSNQRRGASGYPLTHKELAEDSMLVRVEFEKDPESGKTVINEVTHTPTWLWRRTENGRFRFKVIPVPFKGCYKGYEYPEDALAEAYASYDRTMRLVSDYKREE